MKSVLTIAGFDPSSGAGITADLMVFAAHGLFGTSCLTALTIQNTLGVRRSQPVEPDLVAATLDCLYDDLPPSGVKIGMLASAEVVLAVSKFLKRLRRSADIPVVLDPVLRSSSGNELLDQRGVETMRSELFPLVDWITPNIEEVEILLGRRPPAHDHFEEAAVNLQKLGTNLTVVVTAGHLDPPNDLLLRPGLRAEIFPGEHIQTSSTHGTGCVFSSALLSRLVLGDDPSTATREAKTYVTRSMRLASPLGHGRGPLNYLWPLSLNPRDCAT